MINNSYYSNAVLMYRSAARRAYKKCKAYVKPIIIKFVEQNTSIPTNVMFPLLIEIHYLNINEKIKIKVHTARDFTVNKSEKTTLSKFLKVLPRGDRAIIVV